MEHLPEDQKVVELLTKLRKSNGGYPSEMLAARRQTYLKQMANVGLGIGIGAGLKEAAKGAGNGASAAATASSKVLEIALITAIAVEAGTAAFLYRDKIASAIRSRINEPAVQEVSPPSTDTEAANPLLIQEVESSFVSLSPTPTPSATPSSTPSGTLATLMAGSSHQNGSNDGTNTSINANATPRSNENQGNHYGLTPKPERTKDNNGSGSNNGDDTDSGGDSDNTGGGKNKKP